MTFILYIILFIVLFILIIGGIIAQKIARLFMKGTQAPPFGNGRTSDHTNEKSYNNQSSEQSKVFSKDEGEYVDYEEIK